MSPVAKISRVLVGTDFDEAAEADARVEVLRSAFGGNIRSLNIHQCAPDRLQDTDLIVLSMATDSDTQAPFGTIVQVLKECVHPVLFVPSADGILERSSS